MVDKLIIADIAPKFYPQHHQSILGGLNAVDFQRNQRSEVEEILTPYISDVGTRQFLMKSLYWEEPGQLARFNCSCFNTKMEEIGLCTKFILRETNAFIRGGNSNYILNRF
jgi:hypothetical protein